MSRRSSAGVLVLFLTAAVPQMTEAAPQSFVSVLGVNVGNCSSVFTPCRTLSYAMGAVDPGGEVIVLTSGNYGSDGITVAKSVSVTAAPGVVAVSNSPMVIQAGSTDAVSLRGLTLKAATPRAGNALNFNSGGSLFVDGCSIEGWHGSISSGATGTPQVHIVHTTIKNNDFGLLLTPGPGRSPQVTVQDSRFENNTECGVSLSSPGSAAVIGSISSGNACGFRAQNGGAMNVQDSVASGNNHGFVASTTQNPDGSLNGGTMRVTQSIATGNTVGFSGDSSPSVFESLGNNLVRGNGTDVEGSVTVISGN
jgi:hypothetical protein